MSNPQSMLKTVIVSGIGVMCMNKQERDKYSFIYSKTKSYYLVGKSKLTQKEFEAMFPITMQSLVKPTLDGTKIQ